MARLIRWFRLRGTETWILRLDYVAHYAVDPDGQLGKRPVWVRVR